jgi:predicted GNAT superfamily acetyltransferase
MDGSRSGSEIREVDVATGFVLVQDLLSQHYDEVAQFKSVNVLDPDIDTYLRLQEKGSLLTLVAFVDGSCVGYSCNIISPNMHYRQALYCKNDVLFLHKDYRHSMIGLRLIRETERLAKERGAQLMLWHAKERTALNSLLPRLDYKVVDVIHAKEL